jgi:hypothetical protein
LRRPSIFTGRFVLLAGSVLRPFWENAIQGIERANNTFNNCGKTVFFMTGVWLGLYALFTAKLNVAGAI